MHTITIARKIDGLLGKMYVVAVAKAMDINLPNKVKLVTQDAEIAYSVLGFSIDDIKIEEPGDCSPRAQCPLQAPASTL